MRLGNLERIRVGRRVHYRVNLNLLHKERVERVRQVRELIGLLGRTTPGATTDERSSDGVTG